MSGSCWSRPYVPVWGIPRARIEDRRILSLSSSRRHFHYHDSYSPLFSNLYKIYFLPIEHHVSRDFFFVARPLRIEKRPRTKRIEPATTLVTMPRICGTCLVSLIKNEPKRTTKPRTNQKYPITSSGWKVFVEFCDFVVADMATPVSKVACLNIKDKAFFTKINGNSILGGNDFAMALLQALLSGYEYSILNVVRKPSFIANKKISIHENNT